MNNRPHITRRQALTLASAAVAATALPAIPFAAPAPIIAAPTPSWAVGSHGEFNWIAVKAETEHAARLVWASENSYEEECPKAGVADSDCDCDFCDSYNAADVQRQPCWDGKEVTAGDWLRGGLGYHCARCDDETFTEMGGHAVNDDAICSECMTLKDWDIVDPERAAELRAELEDEET